MSDSAVVDNAAQSRYEMQIGDDVAFIAYKRDGDKIVFTHSEVPKQFEGHGVGSRVAQFALDAARADGLKVVPQCPFIATYIERHPEYESLIAG